MKNKKNYVTPVSEQYVIALDSMMASSPTVDDKGKEVITEPSEGDYGEGVLDARGRGDFGSLW